MDSTFTEAPPRNSTDTVIDTEAQTKVREALDSPWQVIVHNDPVNLMTYVTLVIRKIFGYPEEKAQQMMLDVHQKGRSIVWTGERERAELYVNQLHQHQLLATMSQVEI